MSSEKLTPREPEAQPAQAKGDATALSEARSSPPTPASVAPANARATKDTPPAMVARMRGWRPYLAAILFVALGTAFREGLLQPVLEWRATYVTLYPAVILAA